MGFFDERVLAVLKDGEPRSLIPPRAVKSDCKKLEDLGTLLSMHFTACCAWF
jgi:hypothetical protein